MELKREYPNDEYSIYSEYGSNKKIKIITNEEYIEDLVFQINEYKIRIDFLINKINEYETIIEKLNIKIYEMNNNKSKNINTNNYTNNLYI